VRDRLGQDPLSGDLFLFANCANSRLKVLLWDGSGLWLCAKRLEKGRLRCPAGQEGNSIVMRFEELVMLVNGLDLAEARPRKNWLRRVPAVLNICASLCTKLVLHHSPALVGVGKVPRDAVLLSTDYRRTRELILFEPDADQVARWERHKRVPRG